MSIHNICFYKDLSVIFQLSSNIHLISSSAGSKLFAQTYKGCPILKKYKSVYKLYEIVIMCLYTYTLLL